jgi:hypothetical protein
MKNETRSKPKATKLSISLPDDVAAWMRRAAMRRRVSVSHIVKESIMPAFNARRKS